MSTNKADVPLPNKHLCFAGIMIFTLSEGEINELHIGLTGTMNTLFFVRDLAAKAHRGLRDRVKAGKSGGDSTRKASPAPGQVSDRLRPARPRQAWRGPPSNELLVDRLVWNRQRFMNKSDTGKRVARLSASVVRRHAPAHRHRATDMRPAT